MSENEFEKEPMIPFDSEALGPAEEALKPRRRERKVSLSTFVVSCVALVLATLMTTWVILGAYYEKKMAEEQLLLSGSEASVDESLALFAAIFEAYGIKDVSVDNQAVLDAALKEYIRQTGDRYAYYYTAEEFEELQKNNVGESQGIGINIIQSTTMIGGVETDVVKVINVMKDSPAQEAGVKAGDLIVFVGVGESRESVHELGYDIAVKQMQGVKGTVASFTVYRPKGNEYEVKEFSITRSEFTNWSVVSHRCTVDGYGDVGIVKIMQFDLTTPTQFCEAMDELLANGCRRVIFDVRHNPGGDLKSIEAVLSYFLNEDDVIIRTRDKDGKEEFAKVGAVSYSDEYAGCSVKKSDIGKYRDVKAVVLCNGNTASAAELFTATFRDYEMATVVGTTTYGKGSMQSILSLAMFGCPGALKLTTKMYYPPLGDSYEGIGIVPNVVVEQGEAASKINVYEIEDHQDDQLVEALKHFKP